MIKIYKILGIGLLAANMAQAQQLPQYSMYMLNRYAYNSAYGGLDGSLSTTAVFRKQWVNFPGTPIGFQVNAHLPVNIIRSGVGIGIEHDRLGAEVNTNLQLSYNYIADLGKAGKLSIGGAAAWAQKGIDGNLLRAPDGNYEGGGIIHNDDYIPNVKTVASTFSAQAGVYYQHKLVEGGVSVHHLPASLISWEGNVLQKVRYVQHFTAMVSGNIPLSDDVLLQPSVLVKTDFNKVQPELSLLVNWRKMVFGGIAFRGYSKTTQDAVVLMAGVDFAKHFRIAYSYDISVSQLKSFNAGSHEVILHYNLRREIGKGVPPKVIYNPRFL